MKKIVVVGATGMLGTPVTKELLKAGYEVSAMVRNMDKAREKLPHDIHLIKGDLSNIEDLQNAFDGHDYVYLSLSTAPNEKNKAFKTEIEGIQNVIHAAKKTGIKRIGYLSSIIRDFDGFDWWLFDIKNLAVDLLKGADIETTIFNPSNFYESLTGQMMVGSNILLVGRQETNCWWISAKDYGQMVATSFEVDEGNREYTIQGTEPLNFDEAADIFIQNYPHKKLTKRRAPVWFLRMAGFFSSQADFGWRITEAINRYPEKFNGQEAWDKLGKPEMTLKQFAENS